MIWNSSIRFRVLWAFLAVRAQHRFAYGSGELRRPLHRKRIRWRYYLVLQQEDLCSETSAVALKYHISGGRTGELLWWWLKTVPRCPRQSVNDVYYKQVCDLFKRGKHHRNISVNLLRKIFTIRAVTVDIYLWKPIMWSRWKTSEIRGSSRTWSSMCILKWYWVL